MLQESRRLRLLSVQIMAHRFSRLSRFVSVLASIRTKLLRGGFEVVLLHVDQAGIIVSFCNLRVQIRIC